ncbi:MAG: hypothetical protein CSA29_04215 [Desulfobacterales bacterium]|nr:MAG: hypothetical protein CSA29_04215 [Desulfobacterales bacterium]
MNVENLIPAPDTIPVQWGWFQVLLIVTFVLHLLFMNAMLGSGIMALVGEFQMNGDADRVNHDMAKKWPYTIAFTVNMGVAPLLFLQVLYGQFIYTSSILMAVYWLSVVLLLIIAYYCAYIYDFKFETLGQARMIFIALAVVLLLWIGFVFSNNMVMMIQPELWPAYFRNPFGTLLSISEPMLIPRYLHFVAASVAVGGLCRAIIWKMKNTDEASATAVRSGLRWFIWATAIQFPLGIWFLLSLPKDKMMLFMGGGILHTILLSLGLVLSIGAMAVAMKKNVWGTVWLTLAVVLDMVLMRDLLRKAYLAPYFSPSDLNVVPDYSPLVLFLLSFAVGLALIAYMLKLAASAGKEN